MQQFLFDRFINNHLFVDILSSWQWLTVGPAKKSMCSQERKHSSGGGFNTQENAYIFDSPLLFHYLVMYLNLFFLKIAEIYMHANIKVLKWKIPKPLAVLLSFSGLFIIFGKLLCRHTKYLNLDTSKETITNISRWPEFFFQVLSLCETINGDIKILEW